MRALMPGLIERYRDRLPLEPGDPVVTPERGLDAADRGAAALGAARRPRLPQVRGREPDRLLQGPGHDRRGLARQGARGGGGDLRLDRQHRRQRRRLRGPGRAARRGDRARGQDRDRQARPGADARRARGRPAGELRRRPADRPRAGRASTRSSWSTRSTRTGSRARRRPPSRSSRSSARRPGRWRSRSATPATSPPTGAASRRSAAAPVLYGFQAEGAAPLVHGAPVENPETVASAIRIGNPARWEEAMDAFTASRGRVAAVSDEQILDAYRWLAATEGVFCEPASAASVAGLLAHGLPVVEGTAPPESVVCVLTGHGLKDPDTALGKAPAVINCENDLSAVERAVFDYDRSRQPAASASPPPRPTSGRATTRWRRRCRCTSSWRSRRPASSRSTRAGSTSRPGATTSSCAPSRACTPADGIAFRLRSEIPLARGLGSSAAAIVAGLFAADHLFELALSKEEMLARATELEGHPDNVAASIYGGFVICGEGEGGAPSAARFDPPAGLEAIAVIPRRGGLDRARPRGAAGRGAAGRRRRQRLRRVAAGARPARGRPRPDRPRPRRPHPPAAPPRPLPALDGAGRLGRASWARSARRSPAPARPCSSGPPGRTPARSPPRWRAAARAGPRSAASPSPPRRRRPRALAPSREAQRVFRLSP